MKKIILLNVFLLCCAIGLFAQLKVASNGNVGIGLHPDSIPHSRLSVGTPGDASILTSIAAGDKSYALKITNNGGSKDINGIHVIAVAHSSSYKSIAVEGVAGQNAVYPTGTGIGLRGTSIRYGYGVSGLINGNNGTGIYGGTGSTEAAISGQYAGYFDGNVKVTGTINGVTISSSDVRFKKNISNLEERKSLNNVMLMKPIQYNLEQQYVDYEENGTPKKYAVYNEKSQLFQKKHYGLIAQELKELYPDLVYEDDNGFLGVNYTGLIPVLVQSIQELKQEIEQMKTSENMPMAIDASNTVRSAALFQNAPNPFSQTTQIKYYLPETANTASLCVYDLQGKQLKQYVLTQRGEGSQQISGSEFPAGIYLYALIADGTEIDVKRMILTE